MSVDKNTEAFVMTDPNNSFKQINVPAFTQTLPISSTATSPEPVDLVPIANNLERVKNVELSYLPIDDEDNYYKDERRAAVRVAFMLKDDASATGWMKQFPREGKHWDRADEVTIVRGKPETSDFWGVRGIPGLDTNDMVRYQIRLNAEGSFPPISLIVPTIRENVFKDTSQPDPVKNSGWHDSIREERYYFTPGSTISVKVDDNHSMLIPVASQLNRPWRHYPGESE
jgi:hypothetical protein